MSAEPINKVIEAWFISILEKIPVLNFYTRTRGWPFIISWFHRISGLLLVLYLLFHIYTLTSLYTPGEYDAQMKAYGLAIVVFLEWALAIPVIFHSLNGGRLILYENFSMRNDESMIRWMTVLSTLYVAILALLMLMGSQEVSAFFFWLIIFITALLAGYGVASRMGFTEHSIFWRLQRISGAFLLVMVPAHLIFMHLNPSVSKDANFVIVRMQSYFIKGVDICMIVGALYHGAYGLVSVARDYLSPGVVRIGIASFIALVMLAFAWAGIKLTFTI